MPDLSFRIESAEPVAHAATPLIALKGAIRNGTRGESVRSVLLQAQVRIEPAARAYSATEETRLFELFGERSRYPDTQRSVLWTHATATIGPFVDETRFDLVVPCTYDFNLASAKYFHGVEEGIVPVNVLYSGTVFYEADAGLLQVAPIASTKESRFALPVVVYQELMNRHHPNTAFLAVDRDLFDRLHRYRMKHGLATWEQALERLLPSEDLPRLS